MKNVLAFITSIGIRKEQPYSEKLKAVVMNHLNITVLIFSLLRAGYIFFDFAGIGYTAFIKLVNFLPAVICAGQVALMVYGHYKKAINSSLILFPPVVVLLSYFTADNGMEIFIVMLVSLSFYFLERVWQITASFLYITSFFFLNYFLHAKGLRATALQQDRLLDMLNYCGGIGLLFFLLYSVKYQMWSYQRYGLQINQQLKNLNTAKDKIFAVVSHDMRVPLISIRKMLNFLIAEDSDAGEIKQLLPEMALEMNNTINLFQNLLNWSKSQLQESKASFAFVPIKELACEVEEQQRGACTAKQIRVHILAESGKFAWADKSMLEIVLRNFLSNAIKFSNTDSNIIIYCEAGDDVVRIGVKDYGKGIPEELQQYIFNSFQHTERGTANEQGFGLGLMICKDLAALNNGTVHFKSCLGEGSDFWLELPVKKPDARTLLKEMYPEKKMQDVLSGDIL